MSCPFYYMIILYLAIIPNCNCKKCYIDLEAEHSSHIGVVMKRNEASNEHTVLLVAFKSVVHTFEVFSKHIVEVERIMYSNDGSSDNISLSIDGILIDYFETREEFGAGHLWNVFVNSGRFDKELLLKPGDHELQALVTSHDVNGVEIDYIRLELNCTEIRCPQGYDVCSESVVQLKQYVQQNDEEELTVLLSSSRNTLGLAGVIIGSLFGLINTMVIVIMAVSRTCKARRTKENSNMATKLLPI